MINFSDYLKAIRLFVLESVSYIAFEVLIKIFAFSTDSFFCLKNKITQTIVSALWCIYEQG